ncbi:hypothetical protein P152DRAFT_408554 [Eremomyces bilateralis CBS 781.70]|uniref:Amine oxidase n=1 Tax=Eremomyces bilateralis CBS 781.70 TaxID=1392243 RepID=A0A6G1GD55_9PEZI|nr:uncharacterized protein P152DRAFT_408554 [Eremomyces bilateralis CBS 781.70]KAF1816027.1 hypothetical protein P152DRAFT_408554 [Eremomyces bilateralis CBS 781.70]
MSPPAATEINGSSPPIRSKPSSTPHPLSPLSAAEIQSAASLIHALFPATVDLHFKTITLHEPPKASVLPFLAAERSGDPTPSLPRHAFVNYYIRNTNRLHEAIVELSSASVVQNKLLPKNYHAPADSEELIDLEKIALADPSVQAAIAKLQLPEGTVVVLDPWIYGSDGVDDDERMHQCLMYMRDPSNSEEVDSNYYALPLPISPVMSAVDHRVVRVDVVPTGRDNAIKELGKTTVYPANEYLPEYQTLRTDLKPLQMVQPEGASFTVTEAGETSVLEWQKWRMRVGFNMREGPVLHDISYEGRPLFYRVALAEMNVPYADPRSPFHRKSAFDLGDVGAGLMANNLKLGCDCLGSIHYLNSVLSDTKGKPLPMENVICIHEQDGGIGWKHTNFRTGRAAVVRQRQLVVQTIMTVANYEYIVAFIFNQAGEFTFEVRATGILSTQPIDEGLSVPWGTVVHPGVLAVHHQHIFSLRVDPHLDGQSNRVVYDEASPMPKSDFNPHGNGYEVHTTPITQSGGYDLDPLRNRLFKIQNAGVKNPINGLPVAYKIVPPPFQFTLSDPSSFNHKRAEFSDHNIYVVKYVDHELYPGGQYTNQSRGGTGVRSWANRKENVLDEDLVVYVQMGINHVPRIEDFPVMPVETLQCHFKPVNFFTKNPAMDVPPSEQRFNQSTLVSAQHCQPGVEGVVTAEGTVETNGSACCN